MNLARNKRIAFGDISITEGGPVVIIAEIACEHRGNMDAAKRLIDSAKEAGADIAKFQLHVPDAEMIKRSIKFWAGSMDKILEEVNFGTKEEHKELKGYCEKVGVEYLCTPFCKEAADILEKVGVEAYKTGSGELTNLPLLRHVAKKGKPMIVSTGMSMMEEIVDAATVLGEEKVPFMFTHCLSEYPAKYEHMNLRLISELREKFNVLIGFSDHSTEIYATIAAVVAGASLIEKHITIRDFHGADDIVSLDPGQFKEMVVAVRKVEKALGRERKVSREEQVVRDWAFHSVTSFRAIKRGEVLTLKNLVERRPRAMKRAGKKVEGIPAKYLDVKYAAKLLGRRASRDIAKDTMLVWKDVI